MGKEDKNASTISSGGAPNLSILSSPTQAAKMAAEADIRRLLEEDPSPENEQILSVMFDPSEVDRIRKRVQEENDLLDRMTAEASSLQQQQQPAGAESNSQEQPKPKLNGGSVRSAEPSGSPTKNTQKQRSVSTSSSHDVIHIDTDNISSPHEKKEGVEHLKQTTVQLEATVKQLRRELSDMKTSQSTSSVTVNSNITAALQQEVDEWVNMAAEAEAKAQKANSELAQATLKLEKANKANEQLFQELEVTKLEVDTVASTLVKYKQEVEEAEAIQKELREQIVMLETSMKTRVSLLEDAQKRMEALERDNEYLEQQMEHSRKQKKPFWQCG